MKKFNIHNQNELQYFNFNRITKTSSKNNIPFTRYALTKMLTPEKMQQLKNKYKNIEFGTAKNRYTPETEYTTILVFDKNLKNNEV